MPFVANSVQVIDSQLGKWLFLNAFVLARPAWIAVEYVPNSAVLDTNNTWGFYGFYQALQDPVAGFLLLIGKTGYGSMGAVSTSHLNLVDVSELVGPDVDSPVIYPAGIIFQVHSWLPPGEVRVWVED